MGAFDFDPVLADLDAYNREWDAADKREAAKDPCVPCMLESCDGCQFQHIEF